jgi:hypothetical protein
LLIVNSLKDMSLHYPFQNVNDEDSMNDDAENPAAVLVQSALDRWKARCMRADNTSAIVVMFAPPDDGQQTSAQGAASVERISAGNSHKLTVKMSFYRRAVGKRKSIFIGHRGVGACRMRWSSLLSASLFGGVRRRIRNFPVVSRRTTVPYTSKRLRPQLLGHSAKRFLTERYRDFLQKSCPTNKVVISERPTVCVAKHLVRTSSYRRACASLDGCQRVATSPNAVCETLARSRHASNSGGVHDLTCDSSPAVSQHKLNVDRLLPLQKVSLVDDGNEMVSSVGLLAEVNSSSQQRLGSERKNSCSSSDSCSSAARRQGDCIKRTRLQIEALRDG